jgi:hypothetical protein
MSRARAKAWALAAVGVSVCLVTVFVGSLPAVSYGASAAGLCSAEGAAAEIIEKSLVGKLSPPDGATVRVGTPVTFSAPSSIALSFAVASSPGSISDPDIDSGPGVEQPGGDTYAFTSTKATAVARTVYWAATFTTTISGCEEPTITYTTPVRALVVQALPYSEPSSLRLVNEPEVTGGGVALTVLCQSPDGSACQGVASLSTSERLIDGRAVAVQARKHAPSSTRAVAVGSTTLSLAPGQAQTVVVPVSRAAENLLARFRKLPVALTVSLLGTAGASPAVAAERKLAIGALDTRRVARSIERTIWVQKRFRARVQCPDDVIQAKGNTFTCWATGTVRRRASRVPFRTPFSVRQTDSAGDVSFTSG